MYSLKIIILVSLMIMHNSQAKDLGVYGETKTIAEQDALELITNRLRAMEQDGMIALHQDKLLKTAKQSINRPAHVSGIVKVEQSRVFYYDPSVTLEGVTVNPLDYASLSSKLLFIDGDDEKQVKWALSQSSNRLILVKGAPLELSKNLGIRIYFDQGGAISHKLGIKAVPATVSQAGKQLKIEEIKLEVKR